MAFTKLTSFSKKPSDLPDVPSPSMTPDDIRSMLETPLDELLSTQSSLIDGLNANTGASNIGAKKQDGTTSTVQTEINTNAGNLTTHKQATTLDHPDKSVVESKLADDSVSRRTIQAGAVGTNEIDPSIWNQPTTQFGQQAKFDSIDSQLADIATNLITYGCVGDGVADDTVAIQNALNLGYPILIPKGKTFLCSNLTVPNGSVIYGEGTLKQKDSNPVLNLSGVSQIAIKDFTITGQTKDTTVISALNSSSNFRISNLTVVGVIDVNGTCSDLKIIGNNINGGIIIDGNSKHVDVLNNHCYGSSNNGIACFTQIEKANIRGNYCYGHALNGIQLHSIIHSVCSDNICESNTQSGIGINNAQTSQLPTDLVVANNVCKLNGYDGIDVNNGSSLANLRLAITGNQSWGNTGTGMYIYNASLCLIEGNVCNSNGKQGIFLNGSSFNTVQGNICLGNGTNSNNTMSGISLQNSTKNTVTGNLSTNQGANAAQKYGIEETGTSDYNLFDGNTTFNNVTSELIQHVGANTKLGTNQPG